MKTCRGLFINPPIYDFALYDLYLKPLGLLRCAEWLKASGWNVSYINALDYNDPETDRILGPVKRKADGTGKFYREAVSDKSFLKNINRKYSRYGISRNSLKSMIEAKEKPDIVFIGSGMTYWYPGVREAVSIVKEIFPDVPVAAGGPYASLLPEHCKEVCGADFVVKGNAWPGIREILLSLELDCPATPPGQDVLMDERTWKDAAVIKLNSGCPMSCNYCASKLVSGDFCSGNPDDAYNVFRKFRDSFSTKNFAFYDDALLVNKQKVFLPFLEKVIKNGHKVNFYLPNAVHIRHIDSYTADMMTAAGFREIRLGFESSSMIFHDKMDRKYTIDEFVKNIDVLKKSGFRSDRIAVYILAGLPGQRAEELSESIEYAKLFNVKIYLAEYSPVPGTVLWENSKKLSPLPLEKEPVYHNNTFFPMEWEGFTLKALQDLKLYTRNYNEGITG